MTGEPQPIVLPSSDVFIQLTVLVVGAKKEEEVSTLLEEKFRKKFADFLLISIDRVANLTVDYIGQRVLVKMSDLVSELFNATLLYLQTQPPIESVRRFHILNTLPRNT